MIKSTDLSLQYKSIKEEIDEAIRGVIESTDFIGGAYCRNFESEFAKYQDVAYCVGVANGTDGLEIAIESLDLPPGSEIIVPSNSFFATAEAVVRSGYNLVLADVDENTYNISIDDLISKITCKTAAIIGVHLYGYPCDAYAIRELTTRYGIRFIEDCAQAHGAEYDGKRVGGVGDLGVFSFYPGKLLGAFGDAGAITTNSFDLAERCRILGNHGRIKKFEHLVFGRNSRLDGLQAAILNVKLKHLDSWIAHRQELAGEYFRLLRNLSGVNVGKYESSNRHGYHQFVISVDRRDELRAFLLDSGIETGLHYPIDISSQPACMNSLARAGIDVAKRLSHRVISLPIGEHLRCADVIFVANKIIEFYGSGTKK